MKCHICNEPTLMFFDMHDHSVYYQCKSCEFIFKHPSVYKKIEEQKERYDLHENNENSDGYKAYFQRFLDFVLPLVNKPENALDFGCGKSTLLSQMLKENGVECEYYDPLYHPDNLDNSKKYQLIVSVEVFEHLHNPKEVFENLLNRLERGGYLAIQTEFHPNDIDAFKQWYYQKDPTHIVFFREKTFDVLSHMYACRIVDDNGKNMILIKKK